MTMKMTIGLIGMGIVFVLLDLRMHIGVSMALLGFLGFGYVMTLTAALSILGSNPYRTASSYSFSMIPLLCS